MLPDPLFESFSLHHQNEQTKWNKNLNKVCTFFLLNFLLPKTKRSLCFMQKFFQKLFVLKVNTVL